MTAQRTVLLLAYYYPPLGGIGSQRALSFARHLPEHGFRAVVVTPRQGAYGRDASLGDGAGEDVAEVVRTGSLEPAVWLRKLRPGGVAREGAGPMVEESDAGGLLGLLRRGLHSAVYFPDHASGWVPSALRAARRAGRRHDVVAVVSTSPPVSTHLVAVRVARSLRVPAVLDFRDLWTAHRPPDARGPRVAAEKRLERRLLHRAAAVTTVSAACRASLLARYGDGPAKPFHVLRNGFEEEDFAGPAPEAEDGVFRIAHTGTVYGERQDTTAFFRALERVRSEGAFGALRPEVVLAGKVDPQAEDAARAAGCRDLLVLPGFVPHEEAVRLQRTATVNLLLTWSVPGEVARGVCPGKMYEQMAAGRPVLALALPECEAVSVLESTGGALVAHPGDTAGIAEALRRLARAATAGDASAAVPPRTAEVRRHSRRSVAGELAGLLASLIR